MQLKWYKPKSLLRKSVAALVAGTFFFTTVAEPWAQSTFWEQQRSARQNLYREADPQTAEAKALLQTVVWPREATQPLFGSFKLSSQLGSVVETHIASSDAAPDRIHPRTVFHIQDAHGVYGAQYNASKIVGGLAGMEGADGPRGLLVLQEGGAGAVGTDWLASFPFAEVKGEVAEAFLRQGSLTGEEYLAVTEAPGRVRLFGAEDPALYRRNLAARHDTVAARMKAVRHIGRLQARADALKQQLYPAGLLELDKKFRAYAGKDLSFTEYLQEIARLSPAPLRREEFPNIHSVLLLSKLETALDQKLLGQERAALIEAMAEQLSMDALKELVAKATELRLGRVHPRVFYEGLLAMAELLKLKGSDISTAHMRTYVSYLQLMERVDHERLLAESEQLKDRLLDAYSASDRVWRLVGLDKRLALELGLWEQTLTPDQFALYQRLGPLNWLDAEKYLVAQEAAFALPSAPVSSDESLSWLSALPQIRDYYDLALRRDAVFVQNALAEMERSGAGKAVFVAGGFHTPGATRLFRERGVNYVVIQPRFEPSREKDPRALQVSHFIPDGSPDSVREPNRLPDAAQQTSMASAMVVYKIVDLIPMLQENRDPELESLLAWLKDRMSISAVLVNPTGELMVLGRADGANGKREDVVALYGPDRQQVDVYVGERTIRLARQNDKISYSQTNDISDKFRGLMKGRDPLQSWKQFFEDAQFEIRELSKDVDFNAVVSNTARVLQVADYEPKLPQSRKGRETVNKLRQGVVQIVKNPTVRWGAAVALFGGLALLGTRIVTGDVTWLNVVMLAVSTGVSLATAGIVRRLNAKHQAAVERRVAAGGGRKGGTPWSRLALGVALLPMAAYLTYVVLAAFQVQTLVALVAVIALGSVVKRLLKSDWMPTGARRGVTAAAVMFGLMGISQAAEASTFVQSGGNTVVRFETNQDGTYMRGENLYDAARRWLTSDMNPNKVEHPTASQVGAEFQRLIELNRDNPNLGALASGPYAGQEGSLVHAYSKNGAEYVVMPGQPAAPAVEQAAPAMLQAPDTSAADRPGLDLTSFLVQPAHAQPQVAAETPSVPAGDPGILVGLAVLAGAFILVFAARAAVKSIRRRLQERKDRAQAAKDAADAATIETTDAAALVVPAAAVGASGAPLRFEPRLGSPERTFARENADESEDGVSAESWIKTRFGDKVRINLSRTARRDLDVDHVLAFVIEAFRDRSLGNGEYKMPADFRLNITSDPKKPAGLQAAEGGKPMRLNILPGTTAGALWDHVQASLLGRNEPVRTEPSETLASGDSSPPVTDDKTPPDNKGPPTSTTGTDATISQTAANAATPTPAARTATPSPTTSAGLELPGIEPLVPAEEPPAVDATSAAEMERARPTVDRLVDFLKEGPRTFPKQLRFITQFILRRIKADNKKPPVYSTPGAHGSMASDMVFQMVKKQAVAEEQNNRTLDRLRADLKRAEAAKKSNASRYSAGVGRDDALLREQIEDLERQIRRARLAIQIRLLRPVLEQFAARREEVLSAPGVRHGHEIAYDTVMDRLEYYQDVLLPDAYVKSNANRLFNALNLAFRIGFAVSFSIAFGFTNPALAWALRIVMGGIVFYVVWAVTTKILVMAFYFFGKTPAGHKTEDFVERVRAFHKRTGRPYVHKNTIPKMSGNGLEGLLTGVLAEELHIPGYGVKFDTATGSIAIDLGGFANGVLGRANKLIEAQMAGLKNPPKLKLVGDPQDGKHEFTVETKDGAPLNWAARSIVNTALKTALKEAGLGRKTLTFNPKATSPEKGTPAVHGTLDVGAAVAKAHARIPQALEEALASKSKTDAKAARKAHSAPPAPLKFHSSKADGVKWSFRFTPDAPADSAEFKDALKVFKDEMGMEASVWYAYVREGLINMRNTFRATNERLPDDPHPGGTFKVWFVMPSNTGKDEMIQYEIEQMAELEKWINEDPENEVLRGNVGFIYLNQRMSWFENGKAKVGGFAKKTGNIIADVLLLSLGRIRPDIYLDKELFEHTLNPEKPIVTSSKHLYGDFVDFWGGSVDVEMEDGTVIRDVTDNSFLKKLMTDELTDPDDPEPDPKKKRILKAKRVIPSSIPEMATYDDDKNSIAPAEDPGAIEKAIASMAHPENRGFMMGSPRISVTAPMDTKGGVPRPKMTSFQHTTATAFRENHNSTTVRVQAELNNRAMPMFGKMITFTTQYALLYLRQVLQPSRILSHDWQESVYRMAMSLYGAARRQVKELHFTAIKRDRADRPAPVGAWQKFKAMFTRPEIAATERIFRLTYGDEVKVYKMRMEKGEAGAIRVVLFKSAAGEDAVGEGFREYRTFVFEKDLSARDILDRIAGYLDNTVTFGERDLLTFGANIVRDVRWLRGDWQMIFTMLPYLDVLFPAARSHLSNIIRRQAGDPVYLAQVIIMGVFFILPGLIYMAQPAVAYTLLGVVYVSMVGVDYFLLPLWMFKENWRKVKFRGAIRRNMLVALPAVALALFVLVPTGFAQFVIISLIALQSVIIRPKYIWSTFRDEVSNQPSVWPSSSASSVLELVGLSVWQVLRDLKGVWRIGLALGFVTFGLMAQGGIFLSAFSIFGLSMLITSWMFGPVLSHFAGKPVSVRPTWRERIKRGIMVALMALMLLPSLIQPFVEWQRNRDIERLQPDARTERIMELLRPNLFPRDRVPPILTDFSPSLAMQPVISNNYRTPDMVSPFQPRDQVDIQISIQPIPLDALPRGSMPDNVTRTQMTSPFRIPLDNIQAVNLMHRNEVQNREYVAAFIRTVEERLDPDTMRPRYIAAGGARTAVTAIVPGGGFIVKGYEVEAWIEANARSNAPWLNNPLIANYWIETSRLSGIPLADRDNPSTVTLTQLFQWDTIHRFWDIHETQPVQVNGRTLGDRAWWDRYFMPNGSERQRLGLTPTLSEAQYRRLSGHFDDFKYEFLSTAIMSLHYGMGIPVDQITPDQVATFLIRAFELEEMWKAQLGDIVDVTAFELLPRGMKKFNRTLGTILFFVPIRIPVLSDLPLGIISTAEMFVNRPGGAIETMTQLVLLNQITPQQFLDIIGSRYIKQYYSIYFPGHRPNANVDSGLMAVVEERMKRDWLNLRPHLRGAEADRAFTAYLGEREGRLARNLAYIQAEYMLGTTAVYNDALRLLAEGKTAAQVAAELNLSVSTVEGFAAGRTAFTDGDMAAIQVAAREAAGHSNRVWALVNDGAHPRLRETLLMEPGILEGEAVQMYIKHRRHFDLDRYIDETKMVFDRAERIETDGVRISDDYIQTIFMQLPERIRPYVERRPVAKRFMALRSLAMLSITLERNGLQDQVSLTEVQADYLDALAHLRRHPRVPANQPGIVEYFVILRHQLFQRPEMTARWGTDKAAFQEGFWRHFDVRLDRVNQFLGQDASALAAFRASDAWRTYETWVNDEISRLTNTPVISDQVKFYNALMTMTEMVIDVERKFPDLAQTPRNELMGTLAARHNQYRTVFQELNNADWNAKQGFLESFVTAGYRTNDVDREVREVFFLREVNQLWQDGAVYQDLRANHSDGFLTLVRERMRNDFRELQIPETDIEALVADDTLVQFIALQTYYKLAYSTMYNEHFNFETNAAGRTAFNDLAETKTYGTAVMGHLRSVYEAARRHPGIMRYYVEEPGILENEAVAMYLMQKRGDDVGQYLTELRDRIFPRMEQLITAMNENRLAMNEAYVEEMFSRMQERVRAMVTPGGKTFNAVRSLATLMLTGEANGVRLSAPQWMSEYMRTMREFRSHGYRHIPFTEPGISEFFIILKFKLGWEHARFWEHFHPRLAWADGRMGEGSFLSAIRGSDAWRTYETGINDEIARTSRMDVRKPNIRLYNALMSMVEMVFDVKRKFPEIRETDAQMVPHLAERHRAYSGLRATYPNLPWSEKGFLESFVTSGYKVNNVQNEVRMFFMEDLNQWLAPNAQGTNVVTRHPRHAALVALARADAGDPGMSERVADVLILQRSMSIARTFRIELNEANLTRLMSDIDEMERRQGELPNLRESFQIKGEKEKWIGRAFSLGISLDQLFRDYLRPINDNYQLARGMYMDRLYFDEASGRWVSETGRAIEQANGIMAQDIASYEGSQSLPGNSIVRPQMNESQMIADRVFFDLQRIRALNLDPAQFDMRQLIQRYYHNVAYLKNDPYFRTQIQEAARQSGVALGRILGKVDNYAYTFALLDVLVFSERGDAELRSKMTELGIENVEQLMTAFRENLQLLQTMPNLSTELQRLRVQNEFVADGAEFSFAMMLTLNNNMPHELFVSLDRHFPAIFRDYEQFLGTSPRIDSPILLYEALSRQLTSFKMFGDVTDRLGVRTLRLNADWLTDAVVKESYRNLFEIFVDEDKPGHQALLDHYHELARSGRPMAEVVEQLLTAPVIDPNDTNPNVSERRTIENPYQAELTEIQSTIRAIEQEIADLEARGFHVAARERREKDLATWLNNKHSLEERARFIRQMAAEFDRAKVEGEQGQYRLATELLLAMLLMGAAFSLAGAARRRRFTGGNAAALVALMSMGAAPFAYTHWGDLSRLQAVENVRDVYFTNGVERGAPSNVSWQQNRNIYRGVEVLREARSGLIADNDGAFGRTYTKPTNVGFDLVSTLTARSKGLISESDADQHVTGVLRQLRGLMERDGYHGLFPEVIKIRPDGSLVAERDAQGNIRYSSIDSGWLTFALSLVASNYPENHPVAVEARRLIANQDYRLFQTTRANSPNLQEGLMGGGFSVNAQGQIVRRDTFAYDNVNSEARTVVLALVGMGKLDESAWDRMRLRWTQAEGVPVAEGWHMSAFVALTGNIFIDEESASTVLNDAHDGYLQATIRLADRLRHTVFGYSPASDRPGQYHEFGLNNPGVVNPSAVGTLTTVESPDAARADNNLGAVLQRHPGETKGLPDALSPDNGVMNDVTLAIDQNLLFLSVNANDDQNGQGVRSLVRGADWHRSALERLRRLDSRPREEVPVTPGTLPGNGPRGSLNILPLTPPTHPGGGTQLGFISDFWGAVSSALRSSVPEAQAASTDQAAVSSRGGATFPLEIAVMGLVLLARLRGRKKEQGGEDDEGGATAGTSAPAPAPTAEEILGSVEIPVTNSVKGRDAVRLAVRKTMLDAVSPDGGPGGKKWGEIPASLTNTKRFIRAFQWAARTKLGVVLEFGAPKANDVKSSEVDLLDVYAEQAIFGLLTHTLERWRLEHPETPLKDVRLLMRANPRSPFGATVRRTKRGTFISVNLEGSKDRNLGNQGADLLVEDILRALAAFVPAAVTAAPQEAAAAETAVEEEALPSPAPATADEVVAPETELSDDETGDLQVPAAATAGTAAPAAGGQKSTLLGTALRAAAGVLILLFGAMGLRTLASWFGDRSTPAKPNAERSNTRATTRQRSKTAATEPYARPVSQEEPSELAQTLPLDSVVPVVETQVKTRPAVVSEPVVEAPWVEPSQTPVAEAQVSPTPPVEGSSVFMPPLEEQPVKTPAPAPISFHNYANDVFVAHSGGRSIAGHKGLGQTLAQLNSRGPIGDQPRVKIDTVVTLKFTDAKDVLTESDASRAVDGYGPAVRFITLIVPRNFSDLDAENDFRTGGALDSLPAGLMFTSDGDEALREDFARLYVRIRQNLGAQRTRTAPTPAPSATPSPTPAASETPADKVSQDSVSHASALAFLPFAGLIGFRRRLGAQDEASGEDASSGPPLTKDQILEAAGIPATDRVKRYDARRLVERKVMLEAVAPDGGPRGKKWAEMTSVLTSKKRFMRSFQWAARANLGVALEFGAPKANDPKSKELNLLDVYAEQAVFGILAHALERWRLERAGAATGGVRLLVRANPLSPYGVTVRRTKRETFISVNLQGSKGQNLGNQGADVLVEDILRALAAVAAADGSPAAVEQATTEEEDLLAAAPATVADLETEAVAEEGTAAPAEEAGTPEDDGAVVAAAEGDKDALEKEGTAEEAVDASKVLSDRIRRFASPFIAALMLTLGIGVLALPAGMGGLSLSPSNAAAAVQTVGGVNEPLVDMRSLDPRLTGSGEDANPLELTTLSNFQAPIGPTLANPLVMGQSSEYPTVNLDGLPQSQDLGAGVVRMPAGLDEAERAARQRYGAWVSDSVTRHGLDRMFQNELSHERAVDLVFALMRQESQFQQYNSRGGILTSRTGIHRGLMQVENGSADPRTNIDQGLRILVGKLSVFQNGGRSFAEVLELTVASYNCGEGNGEFGIVRRFIRSVRSYVTRQQVRGIRDYMVALGVDMNRGTIGDILYAERASGRRYLPRETRDYLEIVLTSFYGRSWSLSMASRNIDPVTVTADTSVRGATTLPQIQPAATPVRSVTPARTVTPAPTPAQAPVETDEDAVRTADDDLTASPLSSAEPVSVRAADGTLQHSASLASGAAFFPFFGLLGGVFSGLGGALRRLRRLLGLSTDDDGAAPEKLDGIGLVNGVIATTNVGVLMAETTAVGIPAAPAHLVVNPGTMLVHEAATAGIAERLAAVTPVEKPTILPAALAMLTAAVQGSLKKIASEFTGADGVFVNPKLPGADYGIIVDAMESDALNGERLQVDAARTAALFHQLRALAREGADAKVRLDIFVDADSPTLSGLSALQSRTLLRDMLVRASFAAGEVERLLDPGRVELRVTNVRGQDRKAVAGALVKQRAAENLNLQVITGEAGQSFWTELGVPALVVVVAKLLADMVTVQVELVVTGEAADVVRQQILELMAGASDEDRRSWEAFLERQKNGEIALPAQQDISTNGIEQEQQKATLFNIQA